MSTPKTPSSQPCPFEVGHMVWAKVKGYPYWPGVIVEQPTSDSTPYGKRPKNGVLIFFPDSNSSGWATPDNVKDYVEHRGDYVNVKNTAKFKKAVTLADEKIANKGGPSFEPLPVTPKAPSVKEPSTPQTDKQPAVFKAKKVSTSSTPSSVQRDYSRTPFKKEKRSFESALSSPEVGSDSRRKSTSTDVTDNKRVKVEQPQTPSRKRVNSSPSKQAEDAKSEEDDVVSSSHEVEDKREKPKSRASKAVPTKRAKTKYGFIGLGAIGQQLLSQMINSGNECIIWNRTPSKCKEFERCGALVAKTPGDVVRDADITFSCLSDADASAKIFYGNCGVVNEINATKAYVEMTSMDRSTSLDIEHGVKQNNGRYLEAPLICTSSKSIEEGKCVAVIAGDKSLFNECSSVFEKMCSDVFYIGEAVGQASQMNVVIASLNGNILGSLIESIGIAERMGVDTKDFVDIIANSPVTKSIIHTKAQALLDSTLVREIPIDHIRRDMTYALQIANLDGYSTPITAATNEMFKQKKHLYY